MTLTKSNIKAILQKRYNDCLEQVQSEEDYKDKKLKTQETIAIYRELIAIRSQQAGVDLYSDDLEQYLVFFDDIPKKYKRSVIFDYTMLMLKSKKKQKMKEICTDIKANNDTKIKHIEETIKILDNYIEVGSGNMMEPLNLRDEIRPSAEDVIMARETLLIICNEVLRYNEQLPIEEIKKSKATIESFLRAINKKYQLKQDDNIRNLRDAMSIKTKATKKTQK